jgi:hypothetical protein
MSGGLRAMKAIIRTIVFLSFLIFTSLSASAQDEEIVVFEDHNLEKAVRISAKFWTYLHPVITPEDIADITEVVVEDKEVLSLKGIEFCPNLRILNIDQYCGNDISPLQNLTQIEHLRLARQWYSDCGENSGITDLSCLSNFHDLKLLDLTGHNITDIKPLKNNPYLEEAYLDSNSIVDLSPLSECIKITHLHLYNNEVKSIDPLINCNFTELDLAYNPVSDISILEKMNNLEYLALGSGEITDISFLSNNTKLEYLDLGSNSISDISCLRNLENLKTLDLGNNQINNLIPLVENEFFAEDAIFYPGTNPYDYELYANQVLQLESRGVWVRAGPFLDVPYDPWA